MGQFSLYGDMYQIQMSSEADRWSGKAQEEGQDSPFNSCVTLSKTLNMSELLFPVLPKDACWFKTSWTQLIVW